MTSTACQTKYKGDQNTLSKVTGFLLYIRVLPFGIMLHYMPNAQVFWSINAVIPSVQLVTDREHSNTSDHSKYN